MGEKIMKIALAGSNGRMGAAIKGVVEGLEDVEVVAEIDEENAAGLEAILKEASPDVYVEFTNPEATLANSEVAAKAGLPLVIGTTGFSDDDYKKLEETVKEKRIKGIDLMTSNKSEAYNFWKKKRYISKGYEILSKKM